MNRRGFLKLLTQASAGAVVAYSFPSIIVPQNIIIPSTQTVMRISDTKEYGFGFSGLNEITLREIYPKLIDDTFFNESSFMAYMKSDKDLVFYGGKFFKQN